MVKSLNEPVLKLSKFGVLTETELGLISQIASYFEYLKTITFVEPVKSWIFSINTPEQIIALKPLFDKNQKLKSDSDEDLAKLDYQISIVKSEISAQISRFLHTQKLQPYLVDRQIHFVNDEECLLVRPGFNAVLRGQIVSRSASGFFYVVPQSIIALKEKFNDFINERTNVIWKICKKLSEPLQKTVGFLKYIDRQFDKFDHYQARIEFAKQKDFVFIKPTEKKEFELIEFCHPSLEKPKPISLSLDKQITLVTGVNAGGKTMLLKSILSAALMAKYLLPMRANVKSKVGSFGYIDAIVNDPQDVKLDISTFAGRSSEVAALFNKKDSLVGIDEIELGTDSDEASALFSVALFELAKRGHFIIATTHHKRLAALMADSSNVKLVAALYDEEAQKPKFEFLTGTIGKSYAFETAKRYGVPSYVIQKAKEAYGEDQIKLNELIEQSVSLQASMKQKIDDISKLENSLLRTKDELEIKAVEQAEQFTALKTKLESSYEAAIKEARDAAKKTSMEEVHKGMNIANAEVVKARVLHMEKRQESLELKVGLYIKWRNRKYQILFLDEKYAVLDDDGKRLKTLREQLEKESLKIDFKQALPKETKITLAKPNVCSPSLDLHGYYVEEAIETLDKYLSDALLTGFNEVQIMHGMGSGRLAGAVKSFLATHPLVKRFEDASLTSGGSGASIVWL